MKQYVSTSSCNVGMGRILWSQKSQGMTTKNKKEQYKAISKFLPAVVVIESTQYFWYKNDAG